jgi:hypothetical protein
VRAIVVAGAALVLSVPNVVAQVASNASPSDVARDFFAAERDGRWLDAARLLDLKAFEAQRTQDVANARRAREGFHLTVEQVRSSDPSMPRAVAEYYVKRAASMSHDSNPLLYQYARVPSADSLAALPIDVAAARWLEAKDPRWMMHLGRGSGGCELPESADSLFKPPPRRVVAATRDLTISALADSVTYILFRDSVPRFPGSASPAAALSSETVSSPGVLALVLTPGGWRIVPVVRLGEVPDVVIGYGCMRDVNAKKLRPKK